MMTTDKEVSTVLMLLRGLVLSIALLPTALLPTELWADWIVVEDQSHVGFASIKNDTIAENHSFTRVTGRVSDAGAAEIRIDLASVDTMIPIRDERLRDLLFEVGQFPLARVTGNLPVADLVQTEVGESQAVTTAIRIKLHGVELVQPVSLRVTRSSVASYEVSGLGPIIVDASHFGLIEGIEALRTVAGLQSIETWVPITLNLKFIRQDN